VLDFIAQLINNYYHFTALQIYSKTQHVVSSVLLENIHKLPEQCFINHCCYIAFYANQN